MNEAFNIYTLLFLVLAVVIFVRLRSVLGRRTGNERPPYDTSAARDAGGTDPRHYDPYAPPAPGPPGAPKHSEPVVALPQGRSAPVHETSVPSVEDIEAELGSHAPKDSPLLQSLTSAL